MGKNWIVFSLVFLLACSKEESKVVNAKDVIGKSVIYIALDGDTAYELKSNRIGVSKNVKSFPNRHNEAQKAMFFNAADSSHIDFGDLELASFTKHTFTISCWIYLTDTSKPCAILSKRNAFGGFEYSLDNHFRNKQYFSFDNWIESGTNTVYGIDPLDAKAPIKLNKWQHLAFVGDANKVLVYADGILQSGIDVRQAYSFSNTDKHFVLGNGGGYGKNYYFNGAIDDVHLFDIALEKDNIQKLYNQ
jgi:hypothetical protein